MDLLGPGAVGREGVQETQADSSSAGEGRMRVRCYGVCGKPGHNAHTCQEAAEASDSVTSNIIIVSS
jgi:hypothetical protein